MAQSTQIDTSSKFTGTWFGTSIKPLIEKKIQQPSFITWRIHHIDNSKNQIELTEIGQRFESADNIKKPKRKIYNGRVERDTLFVELKNRTTKGKFTFKLNLENDGENTFLKGSIQISDGSKKILPFYLIKVNSNTSTYVKPIGVTKTAVFPPPPPRAN